MSWDKEAARRKVEWATRRALNEAADRNQYFMHVEMDLASLMSICANVQLALRHPSNQGTTAELGRKFIASIKERLRDDGLRHNADMLELGDDPEFDLPWRV